MKAVSSETAIAAAAAIAEEGVDSEVEERAKEPTTSK